ncbi:MAG: phosphate:Na+ symporter [Crocinitomix sp.]|jgi:phosphate:Na+ symporter
MKRLISVVGLFLFAMGFAFAEDPIVSAEDLAAGLDTTENVIQTPSVIATDFEYEFESDLDQYLDPLKTGVATVKWESLSKDKNLYFNYRALGESNWNSIPFSADTASFLVINDLTENLIFEFNFSSDQANGVGYNTYFNTFSEALFTNNSAKGKEEAFQISWAIPYNKLTEILSIYPNANFTIKYNTKIGKKQHKADKDRAPWIVEEDISISDVKRKFEELPGGQKYVYKVGLVTSDKTFWSAEGSVETERAWGIFKLLVLIGSLGMFIFGMKIMSEGLQKAAGSSLRNMLGSITSNRIKGVITGLGITSVVQSSSVTTVMVVSFVNAGLMTLRQSVGVMMGANIGTTMTAWLILVFGFKVSISSYALILIAFGAPMLFFAKGKAKTWASVIIGFALLFMGLGALKDAVPELGLESPIVQFFLDYKNSGILATLMFIGLGTIVTVVVQSSSAAMALTMTMVAGDVLPFEVAAAMILGENIGTTITAQLAALIGNVHAKRAARIHAIFNVVGVFWMILVFHWFLKGIAYFMEGDPFTDPNAANVGIAIFHTSFNIANVLLLIWFTPWLVRVAEKTVKSKGSADEEFHLDYIGSGMMGTPDLSIYEAKKEVAKFGELTSRMSGFTQSLLTEQNKKIKSKLHDKVEKYEEITDRVEIEVATYLAKVSEGEMSEETAERVRSMNSIVNDLERIGDIFYQMSKAIERKDEDKIWFIPEQRDSLQNMLQLVDKAFVIMVDNLNSDWGGVSIDPANDAENAINKKRDKMRAEHLENLGKSDFNMQSGMIFSNLFSSCEKVGDHIINVTEAITGKI